MDANIILQYIDQVDEGIIGLTKVEMPNLLASEEKGSEEQVYLWTL